MTEYLSDVVVCTRELSSEKATDRKKSAEKLKPLLQKSSVVCILDKNYDTKLASRKDRIFTWDDIVKEVFIYIDIETELLRKSKEAHTAATKANREKRKQEISGFLKFVIKQADKRGPKLRVSPILDHIKNCLMDDYTCAAYGLDYSNILLKSILTERKYWTEMTSSIWHELLSLYTKLFLCPECCLDRVLISRVIYSLVSGASKQCDIRPKRLLSFFTEVLTKIRYEKSAAVVEFMLRAMNTFVSNIAENSRVQICKLGEHVFSSLLYVLQSRPSPAVKEEVIQCFGLQMQAHHPCGAQKGSQTAYAVNWDSWMSDLRRLYEVIYNDLEEMEGRTKFSGGTKDTILTTSYVELITDTCHQLFSNETSLIEVTQLSNSTEERSAKKRKIESGWSTTLDIVNKGGHAASNTHWLQIVTRLVQKYPQSFPADQLYPYLDSLAKLLTEFKKNDVMLHVFLCIQAFVDNWEYFDKSNLRSCTSLISQIWNSAVRTVYFHYAEKAAFQLLTSILTHGLHCPTTDLWNIFLPSVTTPNYDSVKFLLTYLENCHLPETHRAGFLLYPTEQGEEYPLHQYSLRKQLFDWLFLDHEKACEIPPSIKAVEKPFCTEKGYLLVKLVMKYPWKCKKANTSFRKIPEKELFELENLYSHSTLDFQGSFINKETVNENVKEEADNIETNYLPMLLPFLEKKLKEEVKLLMDFTDVEAIHVEALCGEICLLVTVLHQLLELRVVDQESKAFLDMTIILKALMRKMGNFMEIVIQKGGNATLFNTFTILKSVLQMYNGRGQSDITVSRILRSLLPAKMIDIMLRIIKDKGKSRVTSRFSTAQDRRQGYGLRHDNDMDIEFDSPPVYEEDEEFDEFAEEIVESQEKNTHNKGRNDYEPVMSMSLLTEHQKLQVEVLHVLALWCGYDTPEVKQLAKYDMEVDAGLVKSKLIQLLEDDKFDSFQMVDIHNLKVLIETLLVEFSVLSEENLLTVITALRLTAKDQRNDQSACCMCLDLLTRLVPRLKYNVDEMVSQILQQCRKDVIMLLSAFWKLYEEGNLVTAVRVSLVQCVVNVIQCDPLKTWANLRVTKGDGERLLSPASTEFLVMLGDLSLNVRLAVSIVIKSLFICDGIPTEKEIQDLTFDKIYEEIMTALDIQANLSPERLIDERTNRTVSSLCTLGNIISVSPVCEKKALFAICQLIRERNVNVDVAKRVVDSVSMMLKYKEGSDYMGCHLPYLMCQWLYLNYPLSEFPYGLLSCTSQDEFYRTYFQQLIPALMMTKDVKSAKTVSRAVSNNWATVLQKCVPRVLIHILPLFAASKNLTLDKAIQRKTAQASDVYDLLAKEITKEVVECCIVNSLDEIVVNILKCLYDPDEDEFVKTTRIRNLDPEPNPPFFKMDVIQATLDYLTSSFSGNKSSLLEVLSKTQDSTQKILQELALALSREHRLHEKRRVFLMYRLFCRILLKEFHGQLGGNCPYVLKEIIHRLIHLIKSMMQLEMIEGDKDHYISNIGCMALELLRDTCYTVIDVCSQELEKYIIVLVCGLIPVVQHGGDMANEAFSILKLLIVENTRRLEDAIRLLDPFPEQDIFKPLSAIYKRLKFSVGQDTLQQHVINFMNGHHSSWMRKEGLVQLATVLSTNRSDLQKLVAECQVKGVSSSLVQIMSKLVQMAGEGNRPDIQILLSSCLGEIGPVDLGILKLPWQQKLPTENTLEKSRIHFLIFQELGEYLTSEDMALVQATSITLKTMLSTMSGRRFIDEYKHAKESDLLHCLHPFKPRKKSSGASQESAIQDSALFINLVDQSDLWLPRNNSHKVWLQALTCTLVTSGGLRDELLALLEPVCALKTEFCEFVLPFLIHNILLEGESSNRDVLSRQISQFFQQQCNMKAEDMSQTPNSTPGLRNTQITKESLRTMLNVVHYLRLQKRPQEGRKNMTVWDNNFWLDFNYLHLAMSALHCSAHFTAVMYTEIWHNMERLKTEGEMKKTSQGSQHVSQQFSQDSPIESLNSSSDDSSINVQNLLLEAYRQIGDPDGVYGCGAGRLADTSSRLKTYEHENRWDKAVLTYDIEKSVSNGGISLGMLKAVKNLGTYDWLHRCMQEVSSGKVNPAVRELQYEAAWKTGQWTLEADSSSDDVAGFNECMYSALYCFKDEQFASARVAVEKARLCTMQKLRKGVIESSRCLYPLLSELQCISQVHHLLQCDIQCRSDIDGMLDRWQKDKNLLYVDFEFLEPVLTARCTIMKVLSHMKYNTSSAQTGLQHQITTLVREAIQAKKHEIAERAIFELKSHPSEDLNIEIPILIEEARFYWSRKEHNVAKHLMKNLINRLDKLKETSLDASRLYPQALSVYGSWLAETHSENHNVILEEYLEKTVSLLESLEADDDTYLDSCLALARFADSQYQNIINYMKSSTFEAKQNLMKKARSEMERMKVLSEDELKYDRYYKTLEKQSQIDQTELDNMERDRTKFLLIALESYLKCLRFGDRHDLRIFRMTSLWFSNSHLEAVNTIIKNNIKHIKSYKFLSLLYQLCARMDTKHHNDQTPKFQEILNEVIGRTAQDHPHQTLPCILALAHAKKDEEIFKQPGTKRGGKLSRSSSDVNSEEEGRIEAAKMMIQRLKTLKCNIATIVTAMETLCIAYIQLANLNVQQHKNSTKPIALDKRLDITQIRHMNNVTVPTVDVPVDPSCTYDNIVTLREFEPTFKLAGGINLPKIITCLGSDGIQRRQLVKGRDDLRQDAVMQQFFSMMNSLLLKDQETRHRQLHVRQYKVIPLSQCSGVLEWCEGTLPIGQYLIGGSDESKGAHKHYRPHDITAMECRKAMQSCANSSRADATKKVKVFLEVCSKFQPVFRYFFMEHFPQPSDWFEKRMSYTKSVATTSIVGYILGLGDRHVQNILVDINTAEFVHIDLGVAFEQGRILPTPETVPFRLTRDIVDGMGISGVEGIFRRCCEKTMEVMHQNQEALLTILEVLLYDPLNNWTMSPHKAARIQNHRDRSEESEMNTTTDLLDITANQSSPDQSEENVNKLAERVLLRLHQKLQGIEDGVQLSVEGQVNHLIQEARDPKNLARLFPGWQPYL